MPTNNTTAANSAANPARVATPGIPRQAPSYFAQIAGQAVEAGSHAAQLRPPRVLFAPQDAPAGIELREDRFMVDAIRRPIAQKRDNVHESHGSATSQRRAAPSPIPLAPDIPFREPTAVSRAMEPPRPAGHAADNPPPTGMREWTGITESATYDAATDISGRGPTAPAEIRPAASIAHKGRPSTPHSRIPPVTGERGLNRFPEPAAQNEAAPDSESRSAPRIAPVQAAMPDVPRHDPATLSPPQISPRPANARTLIPAPVAAPSPLGVRTRPSVHIGNIEVYIESPTIAPIVQYQNPREPAAAHSAPAVPAPLARGYLSSFGIRQG